MTVPQGGKEHRSGLEQVRVVSQLGSEVRLGQLVLAGKLEAGKVKKNKRHRLKTKQKKLPKASFMYSQKERKINKTNPVHISTS